MNDVVAALRALADGVAGAAAAVLPRRHWGRFDQPVTASAWISALATLALGFFVGFDGYLRFVQALGEAAATQTIELSYQIAEGRAQAQHAGIPLAASMLGFFAFLMTPVGLIAGYLVGSGLVRALGSATGQPSGDPLLTLLDAWYGRRRARAKAEQARAEREAREGPEAPDEVVPGPEAGVEGEWVVIASRLKAGWERGVFVVMTTGRWFRLADAFDRHTRSGLRRFYVLTAVGQAEVIRRSVFYDHPRLAGGSGGGQETAKSTADMARS